MAKTAEVPLALVIDQVIRINSPWAAVNPFTAWRGMRDAEAAIVPYGLGQGVPDAGVDLRGRFWEHENAFVHPRRVNRRLVRQGVADLFKYRREFLEKRRVPELAEYVLGHADGEKVAFAYTDGRQRETRLRVEVPVFQVVIGDGRIELIAQILNVPLDGLVAYFPFPGQADAIRVFMFLDLAVNKQQSPVLWFELLHGRAPRYAYSQECRGVLQEQNTFSDYFFTRTLFVPLIIISCRALTVRKERMMNMAVLTYADKWIEAILQMLLAFGVIALRDQYPSCRREQSPGHEPYPTEWNGQMLLPGIAEPYRWEFGSSR